MRNKLGLVQIKVRAKDSSTIDLSSFTIDDVEITGNIEDAKGGKLILFDVYIENASEKYMVFNGVTSLINNVKIEVIGYDSNSSCSVHFYYDGNFFEGTPIV